MHTVHFTVLLCTVIDGCEHAYCTKNTHNLCVVEADATHTSHVHGD